MKRAFAAALVGVLAQGAVGAQADGFGALRFLFGNWQAIDLPAGESGGFTFTLGVQDHVLIRTNQAHYPAAGDRPASNHDDLLVIYREDGSLKADYFDSEGHVIRYVVETPSRNVATLVSARIAGQPRYRLSYHADAAGLLIGSFEIAAPDAADTFKPYLTWKARRVGG
jgi:hypothetical protein